MPIGTPVGAMSQTLDDDVEVRERSSPPCPGACRYNGTEANE